MQTQPLTTSQRTALLLVLLVMLTQGVLRLAFSPLWEHADEYTHYTYLRFILTEGRIPTAADTTPPAIMDRIEATYRVPVVWGMCHRLETDALCLYPGDYQFSQQMPGYYLLQVPFQALLQRLTLYPSVEAEVTLARAVSLLLGLAMVALAFFTTREAFPHHPLLAVGVPMVMALMFPFSEAMTALSSDAGANFALALVVFALTLLLTRGPRLPVLGLLALALAATFFSKASAWIAFPLAAFALLLAVWPRLPRWARRVIPLAALAGVLLLIDLNAPFAWRREGTRRTDFRARGEAAAGRQVFAPPTADSYLWQALPPETTGALRGRSVTLGAWVRAVQGEVQVPFPYVYTGQPDPAPALAAASPDWAFHVQTFHIPADAPAVVVRIPASPETGAQYDGLVLAEGVFPAAPPEAVSRSGRELQWGGQHVTNLLRNPSAEWPAPLLPPAIDQHTIRAGYNARLESFYDWPRSLPVYRDVLIWLFVSFWALFKGTRVGLPRVWMLPFALISALAALGLLLHLIRAWRRRALISVQARLLLLYAVMVGSAFLMTLFYTNPFRELGHIGFLPSARFLNIVIIPALILLLVGLAAVVPRRWQGRGLAGFMLLLWAAHIWSLLYMQIPDYLQTPSIWWGG